MAGKRRRGGISADEPQPCVGGRRNEWVAGFLFFFRSVGLCLVARFGRWIKDGLINYRVTGWSAGLILGARVSVRVHACMCVYL